MDDVKRGDGLSMKLGAVSGREKGCFEGVGERKTDENERRDFNIWILTIRASNWEAILTQYGSKC